MLRVQCPAVVSVIDHLLGHTAVNADILTVDKAGHIGAKVEHHIGNVGRVADTTRGLLHGIGALIHRILIVDPARGDGIDTHLAGKADSHGMRQSRDAALGRRVAFGLRLAHTIARGGNIDHGSTRCEMRHKHLGQIKGCDNADAHGILKIGIASLLYTAHPRCGVIDQIVHMAVLRDDLGGKFLQRRLIRKIADKAVVLLQIDNAYRRTGLLKFFADAATDATGTAGNNNDFVLKIEHSFTP